MTWWGWRAILCVVANEGMHLSSPDWERWLRFYAYYDPGRAHDWWNTGYVHVSSLNEIDTATLKTALLKYLAHPDASLMRLQSFPIADQPAETLLILTSVSIDEISRVVDLCAHQSLCWTVYTDGIVVISGG